MKAAGVVLFACVAVVPSFALATGTARIQQSDGDVKVYKNVRISIEHQQLKLTSADGVGTFVISRAGCFKVDKLVRCYPSDAVLNQHGQTLPVTIVDGTAWLNPTTSKAQVPNSSTQLAPHGLMMSFKTKRGTFVSLTGVVDVMTK
jgi:hypothetical protein